MTNITEKIDKYLNENKKEKAFEMVIDNLGLPSQNTEIVFYYNKNEYELMVVEFKNKYFGMEIEDMHPQVWEGDLKKIKKEIERDTGIKF